MADARVTTPDRAELGEVIRTVAAGAHEYLASIDERPARAPDAEAIADSLGGALPEEGTGATHALRELLDNALGASVNSAGPRVFHFVMGGATPAALGGDLLATVFDQMAYAWVASPVATRLEALALNWLADLFGLGDAFCGVMTTGATMANFVGLGAARQWWAAQHGVDLAEQGFADLPPMPVLTSGYVHASAVKALAMLGVGRRSVRRWTRDSTGRIDLDALHDSLRELGGAPAVMVATAGEVNAGDFDPIDRMADLAAQYRVWLHVDGAFGLFARLAPRARHLAAGVERADSVTVDGHKWLNVPYDCGFALVRHPEPLTRAFAYTADYLADPADARPNFGVMGPESSRRARAFSVWATLRAYGRSGYRALVEHHLDMAQHLAALVDAAPDLERLAETRLNIVCFRCNPGDRDENQLNELNIALGERLIHDGRVYAGTTRYGGKVALRPAIVNWRQRREDIELFIDVVRELAAGLVQAMQADNST